MGLRDLQEENLEPGVLQLEQRPHKHLQGIFGRAYNASSSSKCSQPLVQAQRVRSCRPGFLLRHAICLRNQELP